MRLSYDIHFKPYETKCTLNRTVASVFSEMPLFISHTPASASLHLYCPSGSFCPCPIYSPPTHRIILFLPYLQFKVCWLNYLRTVKEKGNNCRQPSVNRRETLLWQLFGQLVVTAKSQSEGTEQGKKAQSVDTSARSSQQTNGFSFLSGGEWCHEIVDVSRESGSWGLWFEWPQRALHRGVERKGAAARPTGGPRADLTVALRGRKNKKSATYWAQNTCGHCSKAVCASGGTTLWLPYCFHNQQQRF